MKKLYPSSQHKKDYKRYRHNPTKKAALHNVIQNIFVFLQRCLPVLMINGLYIIVGGNGKK